MTGDMFHAAVVPVDLTPVFELVHVGQCLVVVGVDVPQEVPGRTGPLGHGVRLSAGRAAALRAGAVDELGDLRQGRFTVRAGLEVLDLRQLQGKLVVGHVSHAALVAVDDRDGLAPVALAVEGPVFHLELDALLAEALLLEPGSHLLDGVFLVVETVEELGVHHLAVAGVGFFGDVAALDDFDDVDAELFREVIVALVVRRDRHDGAGAVTHHDVVRHEDGDFLAVDGVDRGQAVDLDAGLVLDELGPLELGLLRALFAVRFDGVHVADAVGILIDHRMLGSHDHEGDAEERVGTGRVDAERLIVGALDREVDERAGGLADPVDLLGADVRQVVDFVETFEQLVGILRDAQVPDVLGLLDDVRVADVALAALGVLVRENDLTGRAVVDEGLVPEGKAVVEHLQEDPLGPLVVVLFGGVDDTGPVEGVTDLFELVGELRDVLVRDLTGVHAGLDGIVLGREAVGVKADREQDIVALHAAFAGHDFEAGIGLDVSDVHAGARRVRELDKAVELRLFGEVDGMEHTGVFPLVLPFFLDRFKVVGFHFSTVLYG